MPTIEQNRLVFRFPEIEADASFSIDFQRTLRIPDTEETYGLPPGLGRFPLRHVEDHMQGARAERRGGVMLPMWQAEAMWLSFSNEGSDSLPFPVAVKVAAGKINAVTGERWRSELHRQPQDYVVSPEQPWLDGFAIEPGVIRQFVAMPLGEGYSAEEQITGEAEWGGLQISVTPMKREVWRKLRREHEASLLKSRSGVSSCSEMPSVARMSVDMALAPGGRMHQDVATDPYRLSDWDLTAAQRTFVTLVHAKDWKALTGSPAPTQPPTAKNYTHWGLPWFEFYGKDQDPLPGSRKLNRLESLAQKFKSTTGATLPDSQDVEVGHTIKLMPGPKGPKPVSKGIGWDD